MSNKFKLKKKLVSIALALALAAQPLASFPMNVFAGTGKNGVMVAPTITYSFDLDNIIELAANTKFDAAAHAKNITPQGATVNYTVESQTVFGDGDAVLDTAGNVINPGIAKIKVKVGDVSKETYIIADINGILTAADADADASAYAYDVARVADAAKAAENAAVAARFASAAVAAVAASAASSADAYAYAYADFNVAWNVAKTACESAKTALEKGLDLESKLKTAYMAYRVAEAVWTQLGGNQGNLNECKKRANVLKEVINCGAYTDTVD